MPRPNREEVIRQVTARLRSTALIEYVKAGEFKTEGTYRRQLWRVIRDLYNQEIDEYVFVDDMADYIDNQFTRAWNQGARDMNVLPNQMKDEDIAELARLIEQERYYMLRLADDILHARIKPDGSIEPFRRRADLWANRYNEIVGLAHVWFGGKMALEWIYGDTVDHCDDCSKLAGVVATADDWKASGWKPQSRDLECGGWNCRCSLVATTKPLSGSIPV